MIKNYLAATKKIDFKHFLCVLLITLSFSNKSNSQCATPPVGCPTTDLTNFGVDSNNNASTIEYDNYISSFHSTVVRTANGTLQTWGEDMGNDGLVDLLSPITINATNYPALGSAIPLKAMLGSNSANNVQGILLATDGLYAWSKEGIVLDASITSSSTFQKLTINGNTNGLPTGVTPADVKMMFATYQTLAITTCSGDVWVISQTANVRGNGATGNATTWYQVTTSATGNPFLTNIVACRGNHNGLMALKSDGTVYVWGNNVLLGNNTAIIAAQTRAAQMTLPAGITPKMIGSSGNNTARSYYVLATDGNLYGVGSNATRQLGDWTTTDRLAWVQPRYTSAAGPVMNNIKWFSQQEHDSQYASVNVINASKNIYAFGNNDTSLIGATANPSNPVVPNGLTTADIILTVETGGHTSMVVRNCDPNFGYAGHRIRGSMGDGSGTTTTEASYNFSTAPVQICGAESIPIIQPIYAGNGPSSGYCAGSSVLLEPSPAGGTLIVLSGPGFLIGNTLNFTGLGTVVVQYTLPTACGGSSVVTRNFVTEYCSEDLQVVKTVNNPTPSVGSNVTFTIIATNNGPNNTYGVSVNDVLPAGYTFVSATPSTGTWSAPNWTIGNFANGANATLTIVATVNASGPYANTATISGLEPDSNSANNTSTVTPIVQTNLAVTKTVSNPTPNVGSNVTFTITASNAGPSNATGVTVNDVLLAGYTFVSATPSTGTWSAPNWTIGNLANGANATLTIVATVNASGPYANTATITGSETDPTPGNNTSTATTSPVSIIDAVTETYGPINGTTGGTTPTVVTNDTLNGTPVVIGTNPGQVTLTGVSVPTGLTLNPNSTVTVAPNTPAGSYNVEYTICEVTNPSNCDTVISVVTVAASVIDAVTETYGPINGTTGGTTPTVVTNDTLNGTLVVIGTNPGQVTLTGVSVPTGLTLNPNGTVTVAPNTPAGSYNVEYTICEVTNPSNCDTVISVVTVAASVIDANDDSHTMESGSDGGTAVIDIFANDTLNGSSTGLNQVTLTIDLPDPTGHIVLNPDGTVNVHLGTPAGTYQITYTICEKLNPGNCSTAVVTVIVNTIEEIDIYTHMTPNDDGNNDVFYIDGITKYPNNSVEIYNRWGVLVYQAKKYNNTDVSFDGKSRGRTTINRDDNLPEGTYYYIVRYTKDNGETKEKAGYLYINR